MVVVGVPRRQICFFESQKQLIGQLSGESELRQSRAEHENPAPRLDPPAMTLQPTSRLQVAFQSPPPLVKVLHSSRTHRVPLNLHQVLSRQAVELRSVHSRGKQPGRSTTHTQPSRRLHEGDDSNSHGVAVFPAFEGSCALQLANSPNGHPSGYTGGVGSPGTTSRGAGHCDLIGQGSSAPDGSDVAPGRLELASPKRNEVFVTRKLEGALQLALSDFPAAAQLNALFRATDPCTVES